MTKNDPAAGQNDDRSESDIVMLQKRHEFRLILAIYIMGLPQLLLCRKCIGNMHFAPLAPGDSPAYLPSTNMWNRTPNRKDKDMAAFDTSRTTYGARSLTGRIGGMLASVYAAIVVWNDTRATRNALSGLTDRELEDIGLIRGDIDAVAQCNSRI
ncbi:DUF1127 domain-containing protein [Arenibacterium sp. CAU 1754]